ncbi:MAG: hypothetical protein ACE5JB_01525 [bacterium]
MHKYKIFLFTVFLFLIMFQTVFAQENSTSVKTDTTQVDSIQEIVLEEIFIEAVIEKPNVAILPTREIPDFEEIKFIHRSFEHELKSCPQELLLLESELETVKKIEKIKKILAKEKN